MDEEFEKRLSDYFTSAELVELLEIPVEDLVKVIREYIEDKYDEVEEFMSYGD